MAIKYKKASSALKAAKKLISNRKHWVTHFLAVKPMKDGKFNVYGEVNYEFKRCSTKSKDAEAFCALGAVKRVNGPAERAATAFLREAGKDMLKGYGYATNGNQNIFDINDDHGHKATMEMFDKAIKAAEKAGN